MSKTVSELSQELGVSKQYLNRILSKNKLGRKNGNKKLVSDMDVKAVISILEGNIRNKKSETKKVVSDIPLNSSGASESEKIGNKKLETETETSFSFALEQLEIKGKEIEKLHQLLDQSQQLLLNEQKKNQLLIDTKPGSTDWERQKVKLENELSNYKNSITNYRNSLSEANARANENYAYAENAERWFWIVTAVAGVLSVLLLILVWVHFF